MLPILIAVTFWLLFLVFIISLCKAAARGDEQMSHPLQLVYSAEWEREENTRTAQPKEAERLAKSGAARVSKLGPGNGSSAA